MHFDKRWQIATLSLTIAGLTINRIWDRLSITGSVRTIEFVFILFVFLVALILYLVIGLGNDLSIALFGRKYVEVAMAKICSHWLESETSEPDYIPQNIIEEKALIRVRNVWG